MVQGNPGCPVCSSNSLSEFLVRRNVPVHQNLLMRDQAAAMAVPRGDLVLAACEDCGFIWNTAFDINKIMYGADYENSQAYSPSFAEYIDELVRHMVVECEVQNCSIVDVGC